MKVPQIFCLNAQITPLLELPTDSFHPHRIPSAPSPRNEGEKTPESGERQDSIHLLLRVAVYEHNVAGLQRDVFFGPGFCFENEFNVDLQRLRATVSHLAEHGHARLAARIGKAA